MDYIVEEVINDEVIRKSSFDNLDLTHSILYSGTINDIILPEKCNGCGACARACHEGAIEMVNGKAQLICDDYCDGFGDCLPECPTGAITFT